LPGLTVPSTVIFHSVRLTVAPVADETEGTALGEAAGVEVDPPVGDWVAVGADVRPGVTLAAAQPVDTRARPPMTTDTTMRRIRGTVISWCSVVSEPGTR